MRRLQAVSFTIAFAVGLAGCGERDTASAPAAPRMASAATSTTCSFNAFNSLVNKYFLTSTERSAAKAIVNAMQAAGPFTTTAQDSGFSLLAHIAASVDQGNTDSVDASTLTNTTLACMYNDPAQLPATFPENFLTATDPGATGAYQVRGTAATGLTAPVYNRPYSSPFSVVAPAAGSDWAQTLAGNPAPGRILVYGRAGSNPFAYDWKVIPRPTTFSPQLVVGVCVDAGTNASSMLNEQNVGLLTFVLVSTDLLPPTCSPQVALRRGFGPLRLARHLAHSLFDVQSAWAYSGGVGGSTGGIHSEFNALALFGVTVAFVLQPPSNVTVCSTPPCGTGFSTSVSATSATPAGTFTVGGTTLHLVGLNNNGTPTQVVQCVGSVCTNDPVATTDNSGVATFSGLFVTKTGAIKFVTTSGSVNGRPAIAVGSATSNKTNVNPF